MASDAIPVPSNASHVRHPHVIHVVAVLVHPVQTLVVLHVVSVLVVMTLADIVLDRVDLQPAVLRVIQVVK